VAVPADHRVRVALPGEHHESGVAVAVPVGDREPNAGVLHRPYLGDAVADPRVVVVTVDGPADSEWPTRTR